VNVPETNYAWNGDVALAYQIVGDGPVDLIYVEGYMSHVELNWESRHFARFLRGLASHSRLIVMDRRGYGCSDRFSPSDVPPLEAIVDDIGAVLDAAGSDRAAIFGTMFAGFIAALFAASNPARTAALVLGDAFATYSATDETPWMRTTEAWEEAGDRIRRSWGTPSWMADEPDRYASFMDEREREWFLRWCRSSCAPGALIAETRRHLHTDIRGILPSIYVPTLVIGDSTGKDLGGAEGARFLADRIRGAKLALWARNGAFLWYAESDAIVREIGRLMASVRDEQASLDRTLATVLFTDIVGSTEVAARLGDRGWRDVVERHHAAVRGLLGRYRGVEVDTAGDGFFATFDGPARAVRCAEAIVEAVRPLGLELRAGGHTGEVETIAGTVGGLAVVIGSRVGAKARPSEILVSQTVKDLTAGSGLVFEDAGEHELKGVPDRWRLYRVADQRDAQSAS
jgi:class 3 adenylate cyclase